MLTAGQMRSLEADAIDRGRVSGAVLMERAGQGVVEAILAEWPDLADRTGAAVVLCGPGNNGGDGYVVARVLAGRGWEVEVFALGIHPGCRRTRRRTTTAGPRSARWRPSPLRPQRCRAPIWSSTGCSASA